MIEYIIVNGIVDADTYRDIVDKFNIDRVISRVPLDEELKAAIGDNVEWEWLEKVQPETFLTSLAERSKEENILLDCIEYLSQTIGFDRTYKLLDQLINHSKDAEGNVYVVIDPEAFSKEQWHNLQRMGIRGAHKLY